MTPEPLPIEPSACPLCNTAVAVDDERCPSCGYALAGVGNRPSAFSMRVLLWTAIGFIAVYLITLAIVAVTR